MAGIDLGSLLSGASSTVAQQNLNITNAQSQMASDYDAVNTQASAIVAATQKQGTDEATIAAQQAQGLLQAQTAARSVAASYGGNPDDVSFIMNKLASQWQQTEDQRLQAEKVVQQKQSVSFLDDPLTWLQNKLTVNTDIKNYNNLAEQSDELYDQMEKINVLNTDTAKSMQAIAQTQTAATVAATADAAVQKASIASADAQIKASLYNAQGVKAVTDMGQAQVDNMIKGADLAINAGHLQIAQAQLGVMQQEMTEKAALYQQSVLDKQQADAADQQVADYVNKGRTALGLQPLQASKVFILMKAGGELGDSVRNQMIAGGMTDAVGGKPVIANNPGTAARFLASSGSPLATTNPAVAPVVNLLEGAYQNARNPQNAVALGINLKDPNSIDQAVGSMVGANVAAMRANIKSGDTSNIYQAPPLSALASLSSVKNNPVFTKVLQPQVQSGMADTNPQNVLELTAAAIDQGKISLQDGISGVSALFRSAAALNTETKDYLRFGLPPQNNYVTTINQVGVFGGAAKVDMTKDPDVTNALMQKLNAYRVIANGPIGGAG